MNLKPVWNQIYYFRLDDIHYTDVHSAYKCTVFPKYKHTTLRALSFDTSTGGYCLVHSVSMEDYLIIVLTK